MHGHFVVLFAGLFVVSSSILESHLALAHSRRGCLLVSFYLLKSPAAGDIVRTHLIINVAMHMYT